MIETCNILNKLYDERPAPGLVQSSVRTTRGHDFKLYKVATTYGNIPLLKR